LKENGDMNEVYCRVPLDLCFCQFGKDWDFLFIVRVVLLLVGFVCVFSLRFLKGICKDEIE